MSRTRIFVLIAIDANTVIAGAREIKNCFSAEIGRLGLSDEVQVIETGSFGPADAGVLAAVQPDGLVYGNLTMDDVPRIVAEHFVKGRVYQRRLLEGEVPPPAPDDADARHTQRHGRIVLENCGRIDPERIEEYIANDGYLGLGRVLTEMTPTQVIDEIKTSGLRGRGGAGFPTGLKWAFCAPVKAREKYVICNADEGEPGTFKDRLIMEGDPHKVLEGMAICGYAIGAARGYIYIRGEYRLSIDRMQRAIEQARKFGMLGRKLFGSDFNFNVEIRKGAGAYVCGEETALIESMEGKRGLPRLKPPFPAQVGFRGRPTNVNNVETLANVPVIMRRGGEWFRGLGTPGTPGTKVYTILGHIRRPGLIEVPTGVTLREIINEYGGGMQAGSFHMAQLGGTAGDILGAEMLDVPLDYDALQKVGHVLGSGAILIMNETVNLRDFLHVCLRFFYHESCGRCNPCRNGMRVLRDITGRLKDGCAYRDDPLLMQEVALMLKSSAFCPLGQSPAAPIMSAWRYFRDEIMLGVDAQAVRPRQPRNRRETLQAAV
ncbi:MAG: NADH-quinone oxidoreductase subunit NuoF [Lentisphaerae bacterium]|nr:NADH-quinone oxidoreductase subunit NuoF [Lentisphaerota bacterium]